MVEVFKTNIDDPGKADMLLERIHNTFTDYKANFDLQDCDRILRISSGQGLVQAMPLIEFLSKLGCEAEVLPDIIIPAHAGRLEQQLFA